MKLYKRLLISLGFSFLFLCLFSVNHYANSFGMPQLDPETIMMSYDAQNQHAQSREDKLKKIEAYFIEKTFLQNYFMSEDASLLTEEDRMGGISGADLQIQNDMLKRIFAQELAERDILDFEDYLRRQGAY